MFVEHVELFRCLAPHEDSWLVAAVRRVAGRRILDGTLGCPLCRASYPVLDGVAWFGVEPGAPAPAAPDAATDEDLAVRAAAFLHLDSPGGAVALAGAWAHAARPVWALARVGTILVNPPDGAPLPDEAATVVRAARLPVGSGLLRGAALDAAHAGPDMLGSAALAVRARGRLAAPASAELPRDFAELARDERWWVAERAAAVSAPMQLKILRREAP